MDPEKELENAQEQGVAQGEDCAITAITVGFVVFLAFIFVLVLVVILYIA